MTWWQFISDMGWIWWAFLWPTNGVLLLPGMLTKATWLAPKFIVLLIKMATAYQTIIMWTWFYYLTDAHHIRMLYHIIAFIWVINIGTGHHRSQVTTLTNKDLIYQSSKSPQATRSYFSTFQTWFMLCDEQINTMIKNTALMTFPHRVALYLVV